MAQPSALDQAVKFVQNMGGNVSGFLHPASATKIISPIPQPIALKQVKGAQAQPNYEAMIAQTYKKYGATPDLMAQVPVMAKQVQKNPYLYPYYPAIPIAETSGGKNVTYPGNYFNLGVTLKPYPLTNHPPQYITERTAWRMTTDPRYQQFRQNPSVEALQPVYAPQDSNPHWATNMQAAVRLFPTITP